MSSPFDFQGSTNFNKQTPSVSNKQGFLPFSKNDSEDLQKKELRIVKQAIAKSFIESGNIKLTPQVESEIEKWIKWVFRYGDTDKNLIK